MRTILLILVGFSFIFAKSVVIDKETGFKYAYADDELIKFLQDKTFTTLKVVTKPR